MEEHPPFWLKYDPWVEDDFEIGTSTRSKISSAHHACYAGADNAKELNPWDENEVMSEVRLAANKQHWRWTFELPSRIGAGHSNSQSHRHRTSLELPSFFTHGIKPKSSTGAQNHDAEARCLVKRLCLAGTRLKQSWENLL